MIRIGELVCLDMRIHSCGNFLTITQFDIGWVIGREKDQANIIWQNSTALDGWYGTVNFRSLLEII